MLLNSRLNPAQNYSIDQEQKKRPDNLGRFCSFCCIANIIFLIN